MATSAFRNSYGELVEIPTVAATRVKNEFAAILNQASSGGAVAITRHDIPKAVLIVVFHGNIPSLELVTPQFIPQFMWDKEVRQGM
jgi:antitoxin Phd